MSRLILVVCLTAALVGCGQSTETSSSGPSDEVAALRREIADLREELEEMQHVMDFRWTEMISPLIEERPVRDVGLDPATSGYKILHVDTGPHDFLASLDDIEPYAEGNLGQLDCRAATQWRSRLDLPGLCAPGHLTRIRVK